MVNDINHSVRKPKSETSPRWPGGLLRSSGLWSLEYSSMLGFSYAAWDRFLCHVSDREPLPTIPVTPCHRHTKGLAPHLQLCCAFYCYTEVTLCKWSSSALLASSSLVSFLESSVFEDSLDVPFYPNLLLHLVICPFFPFLSSSHLWARSRLKNLKTLNKCLNNYISSLSGHFNFSVHFRVRLLILHQHRPHPLARPI